MLPPSVATATPDPSTAPISTPFDASPATAPTTPPATAPPMTFLRVFDDSLLPRTYQVVSEPFEVRGKSESSNTLKKVIGGAVAGGVVGAVAGDASKGVLIEIGRASCRERV